MLLTFAFLIWTIATKVVNCQTPVHEDVFENTTSTEASEINFSNVSEFLTTETPFEIEQNSTTSADNVSSTTTEIPFTVVSSIETPAGPSISSLYCSCDLLVGVCDINCCCDQSCTVEDKNAFSDCGMPSKELDQEYCFKNDFIFINNTSFLKTKTSDSVFCIYTDNNRARFTYKDVPSIIDAKEFERAKNERQKFAWFQPKKQKAETTNENEFKVGSPIKILFDNEKIVYFAILTDLLTGSCVGDNRVAYLVDSAAECYQRIDNLESDCAYNVYLNSQTFFKNFSIIGSPKYQSENASDDHLIPIVPYYCVDIPRTNLKNCSAGESFSQNLRSFYNNSTNICESAVVEISYHIFHNGTRGVVSAAVHITLGNISNHHHNAIWKQKHSVVFKKYKTDVAESRVPFRTSGNPGYLTGAPVLAGKIVPDELDEKKLRQIVRLNGDPSGWLTVIDSRTDSECSASTASVLRLPVTFKNDIITGCSMTVPLRNFTDANCFLLQNQMIDALIGWNPPDVVGMFGNSQPLDANQWVSILYENKPLISRLQVDNFKCTNIVKELKIYILYAYTGSLNQPQAKIAGIKFAFSKPTDFTIYCENDDCQDAKVTISTSVEFIDISNPAQATFLDPPQIHLQLPADFFYPFTSSVNVNSPTFTIIIITSLIIWLPCYFNLF